jgi:hypothetical protein
MKKVVTLFAAAAFAAALAGSANAQTPPSNPPALPPAGQVDAPPAIPAPPFAVKVVKVDQAGKTITVREVAAAPPVPGQPAEITLNVPVSATGKRLTSLKAGDEVSLTCEVRPTANTPSGTPIMIGDCAKVIKIEDKAKK